MTTQPHNLIKRVVKSPLGTRLRLRCQSCRESMDQGGDFWDAAHWVQQHVGVNKAIADRMVRDAGRWPL